MVCVYGQKRDELLHRFAADLAEGLACMHSHIRMAIRR